MPSAAGVAPAARCDPSGSGLLPLGGTDVHLPGAPPVRALSGRRAATA